jgi:hypothetical protein
MSIELGALNSSEFEKIGSEKMYSLHPYKMVAREACL